MYALNIDPLNPNGNPTAAELRDLNVQMVRYTFKDYSAGDQPDPNQVRFYQQKIEELTQAGIDSLLILTYETYPNMPGFNGTDQAWDNYITRFVRRSGQVVQIFAPWRPAFQIWNEPDLPSTFGSSIREAVYGRMVRRAYPVIKAVDPTLLVVGAGLASGFPSWLTRAIQSQNGDMPFDILALHPYEQRPEPNWPSANWGHGYVGDYIQSYRQVGAWPVWISEIGSNLQDTVAAEYLRRFYQTLVTGYPDQVEQTFWFCYSDGMVPPFGLLNAARQPKPAYTAYRQAAARAVKIERLHQFAQYLEQNITFGRLDTTLQSQMENELKGIKQDLTRIQIQRLIDRLLAGSSLSLTLPELDSLHALQDQKDLYGLLRSIVMAVHQRTGALTGRTGVHTRISAESDPNAATNIAALMQLLGHIQSGNRMPVMDTVKATADESRLLAPDVFSAESYGQLRNGLIDNHAWNLQKLVRTILQHGYQHRTLLIIRLDGPDQGANVNIFNEASLRKYRLAIAKLTRYLETVLPTVPFKLVLGNEPDLPEERGWSDPQVDPRSFVLNQFAPAMGAVMKVLARQRPDITYICPALSTNLRLENLNYYRAFFGQDRPENLIPALHAYGADVAVQPGQSQSFLEQQAALLRSQGQFKRIAATEVGTNNPFGELRPLNERSRFDDVVAWLFLSTEHVAPPDQDNAWNFRINPTINDPTAARLAEVINPSRYIVLRNIRERSGSELQLARLSTIEGPAYAVEYLDHNTPLVMVAGQTKSVRLTIRNTSSKIWPASGPNPVRLGYHWYTLSGAEAPASSWADLRTQLPRDLLPGDSITLNANLGPPNTPGVYELRWDMVEELKTWFAWQGVPTLNVQLTVSPVGATGLRLSASHNNQTQGADNILQAIDRNPASRWSSQATQKPGMWFLIDLGTTRLVNQVTLNNAASPLDYPRGYIVKISTDGQSWVVVAQNPANTQPLNVSFSVQPVRFVHIAQTGQNPTYWWSIHELSVTGPLTMNVSASHNNLSSGADNLLQALDGRPETRWSSRALQRPGMWFEIDLNEVRQVSGLILDTAGSPSDYPRGYVVRLSTDRAQWQEAARNDRNDRALDINFSPRPARYIRIEQTGSADRWWWSIHQVTVRG